MGVSNWYNNKQKVELIQKDLKTSDITQDNIINLEKLNDLWFLGNKKARLLIKDIFINPFESNWDECWN